MLNMNIEHIKRGLNPKFETCIYTRKVTGICRKRILIPELPKIFTHDSSNHLVEKPATYWS